MRRSLRASANSSKLKVSFRRASIDGGDDSANDGDDNDVTSVDAADGEAVGVDASREGSEELSLEEQVRLG